jgi:phospholipase C
MSANREAKPAGPSRRGLLKAGLAAGAVAGTGAWSSASASASRSGHYSRLRQPGSLPYPQLPAGTDTIPQIEHIVILMMENHSYDNRLGMLRRRGADGFRLGRDGLPLATSRYPNGDLQHAFRMPTTCQNNAPAQDWLNSHIQFDGGRNDGFVESGSGPVSMGYWQHADQPFYYSMASVFPISDRYFCSVLGQTYPNRRFLISATSLGIVNDTTPALTDYPPNGTIFDKAAAAGVSWRDYYTDLATTELYPELYLKNLGTNVVPIADFFTDAAAARCPDSPWSSRTTTPSPRRTRRTSSSARRSRRR